MIPQCRRPDSGRHGHSPHIQLPGPIERMPYQLPIDKIRRVVDGHSREELERASSEEIVLSYSAD